MFFLYVKAMRSNSNQSAALYLAKCVSIGGVLPCRAAAPSRQEAARRRQRAARSRGDLMVHPTSTGEEGEEGEEEEEEEEEEGARLLLLLLLFYQLSIAEEKLLLLGRDGESGGGGATLKRVVLCRTLEVQHISRMECMESCGAPMSATGMPRRAARMGPMVVPQAVSLRTITSCGRKGARVHRRTCSGTPTRPATSLTTEAVTAVVA
ncbi:hypothetical protein EYF80_052776 [Liparis tanakae]|uniref:Uncharacterized protein n=1 Tax=Liparis tanakae TaxID=230148 RepID=A0A4Z2F9R5_9TELE|nr:hypothetical protein EYF80_052776 [Liparis tanakae]